jgi:hypothetical protein
MGTFKPGKFFSTPPPSVVSHYRLTLSVFRLSSVLKGLMILGIRRTGSKLSVVSSCLPVLSGTGFDLNKALE